VVTKLSGGAQVDDASAAFGRQVFAGGSEVELHGEHDHRHAVVLQATLNQKRRFIVEKSVPRCVLLEDDLTRNDQRFRILGAKI